MATRVVQTLIALLSILVVTTTGYAWATYANLSDKLARADVIGTAPQTRSGPKPADGATDVLLVGLDSRTDAYGNPLPAETLARLSAGISDGESNTDTIILLRIPNDPDRPTTGWSIPRDSYLRLPDGLGKHKVNSAYVRGQHQEAARLRQEGRLDAETIKTQARQAGQRTLINTVQELTGAKVDHYAEINLLGFAELTKVLGGVPVCLREPVRDRYSGADFPSGESVVSGQAALSFVRQRHGLVNGDIDRVARQQAFLAGLAHKTLDAKVLTHPTRLNELLETVRRYVVVDQHWDLLDFARRMSGVSADGITFRTIPHGAVGLSTGDGAAVQVDPEAVRAAVSAPLTPPPSTHPARSGAGGELPQAVEPFTENVFPTDPTPSPAPSTTPSAPVITAGSVPCVN